MARSVPSPVWAGLLGGSNEEEGGPPAGTRPNQLPLLPLLQQLLSLFSGHCSLEGGKQASKPLPGHLSVLVYRSEGSDPVSAERAHGRHPCKDSGEGSQNLGGGGFL